MHRYRSFIAVHSRHLNVQENELGRPFLKQYHGRLTVVRNPGLDIGVAEQQRKHINCISVVVNEQYARIGIGHLPSPSSHNDSLRLAMR